MKLTLHRALLSVIAAALLVGLVPAGIVLDWQLRRRLEHRARDDLAMAPKLVADRDVATADALMMRAKDVAQMPALRAAVARGDPADAERVLVRQLPPGAMPVIVAPDGVRVGPTPDAALIDATRRGEMPVAVGGTGEEAFRFALAPVTEGERWIGAAGLAVPLDATFAGVLAGLTRADVVLLGPDGAPLATTLADALASAVERAIASLPPDTVRALATPERRLLAVRAQAGNGVAIVFLRDLDDVLAPVPGFRRVLVVTGLAALGIALLLGALVARGIARPVEALAGASDRIAAGDFSQPLAPGRLRELEHVRLAFEAMREALAARLADLEDANRRLAERERRLTALQAELIQRDRLAASQRLLAELAHEIRNPVANIRNLLEVLQRRAGADQKAREFIDMAIDELLRMHELAEHMLDLNRPRDLGAAPCDLAAVADEVAALTRAGAGDDEVDIAVRGAGRAAVPPDALKQVLLNLVQNARDVRQAALEVRITITNGDGVAQLEVADNGPGIPPEILPRIFDPFFTTKDTVHGTGLGLFVAEGIVRRYGGRLTAANRDGGGARFVIELPAEPVEAEA